MQSLKSTIFNILRWSEKYTKTDMIYLTKGSFWLNFNNIISSIFSFVLSILFARFVSKDIYGNYQFLISLVSIIGTLTLIGMNAAVTQAVARNLEGVFKDSVKTQIRFSIIPFFVGLIISAYYFLKGNLTISIPLVIAVLLMSIGSALNTWSAFISGKKRFDSLFFQSQIINILYYGTMVLIIAFYPKTTLLVIGNYGATFIGNLICYFYTLKKFEPNQEKEPEAISYGKKLSLSSILPMIALHIDNVLIFHLLGSQNLAIYAFASNIPEKFMSLVRPISIIAMPKIAEKAIGWEKKFFIQKLFRFAFLVTTMSIFYILISPSIYKNFFPTYTESIIFSQVYILAAAFAAITSFCLASIFASRSSSIFKFNIWNPVINILTIVTGAYLFGIWGVVAGKIIGSAFSFFYSFNLQKEN